MGPSVSRLALCVMTLAFGMIGSSIAGRAQDQYYSGKTISLFAGFPPGGGVDGEMRLVAHHLPRFIPGKPTVLAKNMPGAGGIVLANFLYNNVAADGLTIGMPGRSGFLLSKIVNTSGANFDLAKFAYIGAAGSTNSILWLRRETGVETIDHLKAARELVLGAWSARSQNAIVPKILAKYRGWPFKVVHGYPGTSEVLIALERGEIDGLYSHEGSIQTARPDLIENGKIKAIFQSFEDLPNVPVIGESATSKQEAALLALLNAPSQVGLPLLAPPGTPSQQLELLRAAYEKMAQDKEFNQEAEKRGLPVGRPMFGRQLQELIVGTLSSAPADVVQEYLSYMSSK